MSIRPLALSVVLLTTSARAAYAGDEPPVDEPLINEPPPAPRVAPTPVEPPEPPVSEGRRLVSLYNSGFQWGISPGVVFSDGKAGFVLGLHAGYGFDEGPVILVPGVRLAGYFVDPTVLVGMPDLKLVFPIDRFAPFVVGGAGVGHVGDPSTVGLALLGGGGFMIYFDRVAFGAEATYQTITGTSFRGLGIGPVLALGF